MKKSVRRVLALLLTAALLFGCCWSASAATVDTEGKLTRIASVMNGDTVGGVTIMYMAQGLDTGDIILQKRTDIPPLMTAGEYHDVLASLGGEAITEYLSLAASGSVPRTPQDDSLATYAAKTQHDTACRIKTICMVRENYAALRPPRTTCKGTALREGAGREARRGSGRMSSVGRIRQESKFTPTKESSPYPMAAGRARVP